MKKHLLTSRQAFRPLVIIALLLLMILVLLLFGSYKSRHPVGPNADDASAEDLYAIQKALINRDPPLPSTLDFAKDLGLHANIAAYDYSATPYDGGPTIIYRICATFSKNASNILYNNETNGYLDGLDVYRTHRTGKQCYENSMYKSGSHIKILD